MPKTTEKKEEVIEVDKQELAESPKWEIAASDIDIPRFNIRQKSSEYDSGEFGDLVIDKSHVVVKEADTAEVIVISAVKAWREKIPYEMDIRGRIARTEEERAALASDSEYEVREFADITMLIPQHDGGDEDAFQFPIGDKMYAMGKLDVQNVSYRNTYKRLCTFAKFNPKEPLTKKTWTFKTEFASRGKTEWYNASLTIAKGEAPEAVVDFIENFTS